MKSKHILGALALSLFGTVAWAQSTPTGAATSTTFPQGAVVSDSMPSEKASRSMKRASRRNRADRQTNRSTPNNTTQEGRYRQSSSANGTSVNNSNTTNYNSNNATNAPTGVGSNTVTTGKSNQPE